MTAPDLITYILPAVGIIRDAAAAELAREAAVAFLASVRRLLGGNQAAEVALKEYPDDPDTWMKPLLRVLEAAGAARDAELLAAVEQLRPYVRVTQTAAGQQVIQAAGDVSATQIGHIAVHVGGSAQARRDIGVSFERFNKDIAPDHRSRGFKVALVRADTVDDKRFDGWEGLAIPDPTTGELGRAVVFANGRVDLVGMRRRLVSYGLSDLAKEMLVAASRAGDRGVINFPEFDQPPGGQVQAGGKVWESFEATQGLRELIDGEFVRHMGGVRYELTKKGWTAAEELVS